MAAFDEISITLPDGYEAYARYWFPSKPRGAVLYLHGIQSHGGWFEASARRLAETGWAVLQVDRRGCGKNVTDRGHAASADQLIQDTRAAGEALLQRAGVNRYHVLGVSWGGKLGVASYVTDPAPVSGLTLVTPGLFPLDGVSKDRKAEIGFAMLYEPDKLFDIPLNDGQLFTSLPKWQSFIDTDPLTLRQCTAGFYLASRRMDKIVARLADTPPIPLHLLLAGDERIIDNQRTVEFIERLGWPQTQTTHYPGTRHSVEFESARDNYFDDLAAFIK